MRALLTSVPAVGHVVPLIGVAGALRDAGHDVLVATHPRRHQLVQDQGLDAVAAGMSDDEMRTERRRRWPDTHHQPPSEWAVRMFTQIMAPSMLEDLRPPQGTPSQLRMANACELAGVARVVRGDGVEQVDREVASVLEDRSLAERAADAAGQIAATPGPAHLVRPLVELAAA